MSYLLAVQQYLNEMIRLAGPGMKVLLMDKETVRDLTYRFFCLDNKNNTKMSIYVYLDLDYLLCLCPDRNDAKGGLSLRTDWFWCY